MITQMKKPVRQKPGPKPTGKGELIGVRLLPDLLAGLDKHVAATGAESRPAAVRQVLVDFLKRKGLI